jgi:hypothetical protein
MLTVKAKSNPSVEAGKLFLRAQKCTKSLDLTLKFSTTDLPLVTISLDFLQLSFKTRHLVNALLAVTASCKGVGLALLDLGWRLIRGTAFGRV